MVLQKVEYSHYERDEGNVLQGKKDASKGSSSIVPACSLGAVLFVMLGGRYPFDGKAMPLEAAGDCLSRGVAGSM